MKIEPKPEPLLIDIEESPQPRDEEEDHTRVAIREDHCPVPLGTLPCVQGGAGNQELFFRKLSELAHPFLTQTLDLRALRLLQHIRPADAWQVPARPGPRDEVHIADPEGDGGLRHPDYARYLMQCEPLGSQLSRLTLFQELAAVAHLRECKGDEHAFYLKNRR